MQKNSMKNMRINGEVQRELSNIIRSEVKDPRIAPMTSVVAVEVAPDLKTCKAYISVFGDEEAQNNTIKGLNSAEGYIRHALAKSINLRKKYIQIAMSKVYLQIKTCKVLLNYIYPIIV